MVFSFSVVRLTDLLSCSLRGPRNFLHEYQHGLAQDILKILLEFGAPTQRLFVIFVYTTLHSFGIDHIETFCVQLMIFAGKDAFSQLQHSFYCMRRNSTRTVTSRLLFLNGGVGAGYSVESISSKLRIKVFDGLIISKKSLHLNPRSSFSPGAPLTLITEIGIGCRIVPVSQGIVESI